MIAPSYNAPYGRAKMSGAGLCCTRTCQTPLNPFPKRLMADGDQSSTGTTPGGWSSLREERQGLASFTLPVPTRVIVCTQASVLDRTNGSVAATPFASLAFDASTVLAQMPRDDPCPRLVLSPGPYRHTGRLAPCFRKWQSAGLPAQHLHARTSPHHPSLTPRDPNCARAGLLWEQGVLPAA